jgi:Flp pilus assembly protein TadD
MAICNPAHEARIRQCRLAVDAAREAGEVSRIAHAVRDLADALRLAGRSADADAAYAEARALRPPST